MVWYDENDGDNRDYLEHAGGNDWDSDDSQFADGNYWDSGGFYAVDDWDTFDDSGNYGGLFLYG